MKTQLKWNRSSALLGTALVGAVALAGCPSPNGPVDPVYPVGSGAVATVNGKNIERNALHSHLEATHGEEALRQLIDYELVMQELKTKGLEIGDAEVNAAVEQRGRENEMVAQLTGTPGPAQEALKRQVRYQLAIDKLLTADVKVDEAALKTWFDKNKARYDQPERVKLGFLLSSTKQRADLMVDQLKKKSKTFLQLVDEQKAANDPQAKNSMAEIPQFTPANDLPPELRTPVSKLKDGETSGVLTLGQGAQKVFAIIRLVDRQEGKKADLTAMRPQVENDYKLEQVAKKLVAENPQNPPFEETIKRVEMTIMQQSQRKPSYHDILSFINQTGASQLTTRLREAAKVEVSDKAYAKVGEEFKPAPTAPALSGEAAPSGGAENKAAPAAK